MAGNVAASMTASIIIDKKEIVSSALAAYADAQKELDGNKLELLIDVSDDKAIEKVRALQKELGSKEYIIKFNNQGLEETLKSIDELGNKLKDLISGKLTGNGKGIGNSIVDEQQLKTIIDLFGKMESHLDSMRKVFSDVGDGEEFSPLLQTIKNVESAVKSLDTTFKGIDFNMNIDVGSNSELENQLQSKVSNALSAYERLFEHIKMSNAGDSYMMNNFFDFDINQFDTMMAKVQAYRTFIENQRKDYESRNGYSGAYDRTDKKYWNQVSSAMGEITKVQNKIKASNDTSALDGLFGKTDLTEVISGLNQIVLKLDEIIASANELKNTFGSGLKIEGSTSDIVDLTNKVKELEDELNKLKVGNNSSADSSMQDVENATTSAAEAKEKFVSANENVQGSVDGSKSKLELEAELMDKIAQSAKEAANAKEKFVAANEKVSASVDKTEGKATSHSTEKTSTVLKGTKQKESKTGVSSTDDTKTKESVKAYKELNDLIDRYISLKQKEAKGKALSGDLEALENIRTKIDDIITTNGNGFLNDQQINESNKKLLDLIQNLDYIKKNLEDVKAKSTVSSLTKELAAYETEVSKAQEKLASRSAKPAEDQRSNQYEANLTNMRQYVDEMITLQKRMATSMEQGISPSSEDTKRFSDLKTKIQECEQAFKSMSAAEKGASEMSRDKLFNKIGDYLQKNSGMAKEFKVQLQALQKELSMRGADANVSDLTDKFLKLQIAIREAGQEGRTFLDVVKDKAWYGLAGQIATYFSFQDIVRYIGQGIQVVRELDTARTEMMKVSDESEKSLRNYQKATFDVADAVGTTAKQIQNSTADYMRLGEALDDAAESARVANVLLNVSEFDNIEDATKSLVSMGQAYKDLDKMSIVDKLNEVGNNYSISTDELAGALQRSAATLSLMGNTIDEAAALVTTANSVIQDADSVSAGLRTISLRLVGTEEAEEELSAMNEEIDAFVAATNSKKQQIIKDYTAVASNNYKGFDILDDNGNYKNTYEILLGIAKVYKEIQEQDKKLGTNHAVALVEELAGKNRSNIASAILQDPKQLEAVRKSSEEAFGSAEEELGKYLDSIDGRLAQMTNRVQEFWSTAINDNAIKNIISFATTAIELFTKLSDTFGLVNVGALGLGAVLSTQNVGRGKMYPLMFEYADNNMCSLGY